MLFKVQKYIHSISSTPHLEALQEACQLFEKEREQWKQERLALLKRIEALEEENKQLREQFLQVCSWLLQCAPFTRTHMCL